MLSAACHDIGMSVSASQKNELLANVDTPEWWEYFKTHLKDEEEFSETGKVSEQMLRSYVRVNHHKRIAEHFDAVNWPSELSDQGIDSEMVIRLCRSHGEPIDEFAISDYDTYTDQYDLCLCAVLLRLADILDFDVSRAPAALYRHLGLAEPVTAEEAYSRTEWDKNCTLHSFDRITDGVLPFKATCTSMQIEHEIRSYMDWVQRELDSCGKYLARCSRRWATFHLPYKLSVTIIPNGYKSGNFCLTMDQDRILELLVGRNLYSDPGIFVRELLQNAIDAIHTRNVLDPYFNIEDGKIVIRTWMDGDGRSWFRIEDNGIGMDEAVINNYFLKVGRSYYASEDFKADKRRYGRGKDYTPISRFGIGILSCFMSDPEHNTLEVSTRRFSRDPDRQEPAVRLNVTGLHGYYYLAKEGEQQIGLNFQPMHHPENKDTAYRRNVGTTVCVQIDLYQLENHCTFKDIVDRYVQFPEIPVEYYGPEGHIRYATEKELMDHVHRLNPDGPGKPLKEYVYPLSDMLTELFNHAKVSISWKEAPALVIRYCPLDWVSTNGKISGVAIFLTIKASGYSDPIQYCGSEFTPELNLEFGDTPARSCICLEVYFSFPASFQAEMAAAADIYPFNGESFYRRFPEYKIPRLESGEGIEQDQKAAVDYYKRFTWKCFPTVSYDDLLKQAGTSEINVFRSVKSKVQGSDTIAAYNGILADTRDILRKSYCCMGILLLLKDDYRPEVSLARDTISDLPLEAFCNLTFLRQALFNTYNEKSILQDCQFDLLPQKEIGDLLNKHTDWEAHIIINGGPYHQFTPYSLSELRQAFRQQHHVLLRVFNKYSFYDILCLTALKQRYSVYVDFSNPECLYVADDPPDNSTDAFPPSLFFSPTKPDRHLAYIVHRNDSRDPINYFNKEHSFSRWLIHHQAQLQESVPVLYKRLLKAMISGNDKLEIQEDINDILHRLKEYHHNMFAISDELFLTNSDFL